MVRTGSEQCFVFSALKHFVNIVMITVDKDMLDNNASVWKYEEFFKSSAICLDSFSMFLSGIIKNINVNELDFQVKT